MRFAILSPGKSIDDTEYATIGGGLYNTYSYADHSFITSKKLSDAPTSPKSTYETDDYMKPTASLRYIDLASALNKSTALPSHPVAEDYEEPVSHSAELESEASYERPVSYVEVLESDT